MRAREPGLTTAGYYGMPEATAAALRDGWLHTGDLATRDADGNHFFAGRRKEVIRRRGENISAFEVEEVVRDHPDVLDAAAYGVPSPLSEEDVMVAVVAAPGAARRPGRAGRALRRGRWRATWSRATSTSSPSCPARRPRRSRSTGWPTAA